jgi:RNA polymerase sigma-70 factor (ECF subfamily)
MNLHHSTRGNPAQAPDAQQAARGTVVPFPVADSDSALVAALKAKRVDARRVLYERYGSDVERVLYRILGPDSEMDDILQDVFLAALASVTRLRQADKLKSYLIGIAVRKARKVIRQRRLWRFIHTSAPADLPDRAAPTAPEHVSDALRATYRILAKLPVDERITFALRHVDGMELGSVAEVTGVSLSTVKRRLTRAQSAFKRQAQQDDALSLWLTPRSFQR